MLSVSERFKKAFEQVDKPRKIKAIVTLKNVSYKNDQLFHVEYNSEAISGDTFAIGSTFSNNIKVTIDKVVEGIKQQDQLTYQLGIVVEPNETELADMKSKGYTWDVIEYVPMGTFFVTSYNPDRNENRTIIEASDSMSFLESTYSSNLTYPAYLKDIALDVANKNGLVVDSGSLNRLPQIQIKRPEKVSYRQVLGIIAQYQKGFATFDRQNRLAIRALNDPKYTVSTNNYFLKGLVKEELLYKVDGISCKVEKEDQTTVLQAGKTTGNQIVLENSSMTQIDLDTIFSGLSTLNYYPYSLKWRGNPALEVGDWISLNDIKTNSFKVPNLSYKLTFSGGLTAESSAHTKSISETTVQYRGPLNQKIEDITGWISAAGGFSYTGLDEPQNPKEKDVWFKPNGPDMEMWIFENGKWKLETSTADVRELSEAFEESNKKIEQAEKDLAQAKLDLTQNGKDIEQNKLDILDNIAKTTAAKTELDQAKTDLVIAAGKIDSNKTYMDQVKAQADEIDKKADDAKTASDLAKQVSNEAKTNADNAKSLANIAKANADKAISDAASAVSNANAAKSNAATALSNANTAIANVSNVDQKVTTEVKRIDDELSSKATKTTVDTLSGTVTNQSTLITQAQNDIKLKANQSTVDTLNKTVTNQGTSIDANAKAIELKASQTEVNTITGRVTSAESSIKVQDSSIKSLVSKTDGTNTKVAAMETDLNGFKTNVVEKFDKQIVGGDNLIFNSGDFESTKGWTFEHYTSPQGYMTLITHDFWYNKTRNTLVVYNPSTSKEACVGSTRFDIKKNTTYTLVLTAFNSWNIKGCTVYMLARRKQDTDKKYSRIYTLLNEYKFSGSEATTKVITFNTTSDMLEDEAYIRIDNSGSDKEGSTAGLYVCEVSLREGNLTQPWSPSILETNDRISSVKQTVDTISSTVVKNSTDISGTITKVTSLEQDLNGFKQTVANTYETQSSATSKVSVVQQDLNTYKASVTATYETKTSVKNQVSSVSNELGKFQTIVGQTYTTKDEFGNIVSPGDNLVENSGNFDSLNGWEFEHYTSPKGYIALQKHDFWYNKTRNTIAIYNPSTSKEASLGSTRFDVKKKTTYTLVITAFNSWNTQNVTIYFLARRKQDTDKKYSRVITLANNFKFSGSEANTKVVTFTTPDMLEDEAYIRIDNSGVDSTGGTAVLFVCELSFREGNIKAGWAPSTSNEITSIKQTINTIDLSVVKKDNVVSAINLNPEGLRLKGSLIYLDGNSYISNGVIKDAHIADATITSASIANLAVTTAKIAKLAVTDALIANATITAASIADLAITSAKIGNLAVTNAKIGDLAVNGAKIANAAITEAKIEDAAIVNAHIKDATIESAKIKSINAEKITAGTLNAANVNIINLNANNITSGNINGINITGSTVTSQKGSSKIVLDGGALSWYTSNGIVGSIYTTEENYENFANWDVYDNGYFSIRGKGTRDGETYMRYGWGELKSIVSGMVSIISKNKYADRSTSLELNNSQVILKAGSGSGSSYRQGQIQVGAYGTSVTGGMTISGGLSVTGSKNAIHQVDGQWYATPAYETAESYLGDIGSTTTNNDSMVLISIDNLFGRIVNTSLEYQVFVSSYGSGHVWVEKRTQNAFIVRSSEPNAKFAWEIKAKRKGYEQERLVKHSLIA